MVNNTGDEEHQHQHHLQQSNQRNNNLANNDNCRIHRNHPSSSSLISEISIQSNSTYEQCINIHRSVISCQDIYPNRNGNSNFFDNNSNNDNNGNNGNTIGGKNNKKKKEIIQKYYGKLSRFYQRQRYSLNLKSLLFGYLPFLEWLPKYNLKYDLFPDIIVGLTVLALNIPQGLAYGHLAGAEPIHGLYVSLFPVIIYALLGTSKHISIGTFSVISIACKDIVESFELGIIVSRNREFNYGNISTYDDTLTTILPETDLRPIDILTSLCLLVGIIQFLLGFLKLGVLSILLSDILISAFVIASSMHVFTSQIFELIGIESKHKDDYELPIPLDIIQAYIRFFGRIHKTNIPTLILTIICFVLLAACKYSLEPFIKKRYKFKTLTIPIDMTLIILTTLFSALFDFKGRYEMPIIEHIPNGFNGMPKVPDTSYMARMIPGAFMICVISYIFTYSLGQTYSKKHAYKIDSNQELIAMGSANIFSSFFQCYPCCASISRSAVQESVGGKTQVVSLVSSIFMVIILLFLTTYLKYLPKNVLACIITIALVSTMKRVTEFIKVWRDNKLDGLLWIGTFLLVVLLGVDHGLLYSVVFSFVILIIKLVAPTIKLKYQLTDSELFVEASSKQFEYDRENFYHCLSKENGCIVFEFQGPLIFMNALIFRTKFYSLIGRFIVEMYERDSKCKNLVILDCTRMIYIDAKGVEALLDTFHMMKTYQTQFILAGCSEIVYKNLDKFKFFNTFNPVYCYMSVIDAIVDNQNFKCTNTDNTNAKNHCNNK